MFLKLKTEKTIENNCKKKFFVSPFMDLESSYYFKILYPGDKLSVVIDQKDEEGKLLYASQDGDRVDLPLKILFFLLKTPL